MAAVFEFTPSAGENRLMDFSLKKLVRAETSWSRQRDNVDV